jgi:hypothetical protein
VQVPAQAADDAGSLGNEVLAMVDEKPHIALGPVELGDRQVGLAQRRRGDYPEGVGAWAARIDANTNGGGMTVDQRFFPHGDDFHGLRVHQTRLQGGDASSDSYCFVD